MAEQWNLDDQADRERFWNHCADKSEPLTELELNGLLYATLADKAEALRKAGKVQEAVWIEQRMDKAYTKHQLCRLGW